MGRRQQRQPEWEDSYDSRWHAPSHGAKQYKGAGRGREQQGSKWNLEKPERPTPEHFPNFENMQYKARPERGQPSAAVMAVDEGLPAATQYINGVQKILNGIRKAEGKARRLEEEQHDLNEKWAAFQKGLKDAYVRERARYKEKIARLQNDLREQQTIKAAVLADLQEALCQPNNVARPRSAPSVDQDALTEFEALLAAPQPSETGSLSALLAGAFSNGEMSREDGRRRVLATIEAHMHRKDPPATPPKRPTTYDAMTPPPVDACPAGTVLPEDATRDKPDAGVNGDGAAPAPYVSSPSTTRVTSTDSARSRSRTSVRTPIKAVGRKPQPVEKKSGLSGKLEAARLAEIAENEMEITSGEEEFVGSLGEGPNGAEPPNVE